MPINTRQSNRIIEYLKLILKALYTWVYVAITLSPYYTPRPLSFLLQIFFASSSDLYSPLFNNYLVNPIINDLLRLMSYPTYTNSGIKPTSSSRIPINPCKNLSSMSLIFILSPSLCCNTQPYIIPCSSTTIPSHLPTNILISITNPVTSTKGRICHYPLSLPWISLLEGPCCEIDFSLSWFLSIILTLPTVMPRTPPPP